MHPFPTTRARALRGITPAGENIATGGTHGTYWTQAFGNPR